MKPRRAMPEPFGLSVLDTVTCGLGGAIVILLYAASTASPGQAVSVATASAAPPQAGAAVVTAATGLLTIVFAGDDLSGETVATATDCTPNGQPLSQRVLWTAHRLRQQQDADIQGLTVWAPPSAAVDNVCVTVPAGSTRFQSTTEGSALDWRQLGANEQRVCFIRNAADGILDLKPC